MLWNQVIRCDERDFPVRLNILKEWQLAIQELSMEGPQREAQLPSHFSENSLEILNTHNNKNQSNKKKEKKNFSDIALNKK